MLEKWLENPSALTVTGVLLALIVALVRETLVPGVVHRRDIGKLEQQIEKLEKETDRLNETIYRLLGYAGKATDMADRATGRV